MLKNFIKIALRQLKKNKGYSFLNVIGLAMGMACAMLILLWVNDEFQYNKFHRNYKYLYKALENQSYEGKTYTFSAMPGLFAPSIKQELPEIKYAVRANWGDQILLALGENSIYEPGYYTDPEFLKMFSFKIIEGDPNTLLTDPSSIVITDKLAIKFFGSKNVIGKTLKINNDKEYKISGIIEEPPLSSTLKFSWLISFKAYEADREWLTSWGTNGIQTYVQLNEEADPVAVNRKLHDFIAKKDTAALAKPFLLAMKDWRLRTKFEEGKQTGGRIENVRLFSIIAILVIIIACINFMNLATARSEQRAREVGVRKTMGAGRGVLIRQFFGESIVMSLAAMVIAGLIVMISLPAFNNLVEKKLSFDFTNPVIWGGLPALAIICGLLAGSYPSLYLSSFNPVTVFKGIRVGKDSIVNYVRKGLVVIQFVISIVLIISTVIIYKQIQHIKNRDLGYKKENIIFTDLNSRMKLQFPAIYNDLLATQAVENAALSSSRVLSLGSSTSDVGWQGKMPNSQVLVTMEAISPQYIKTMGMELKAGRSFYDNFTSDSSSVIINETMAKLMKKENAVGDYITYYEGRRYQIVGVVKDFVFNDMYRPPDPLVFYCDTNNLSSMIIRLKANKDVSESLAKVGAVIKANNPGYPFEYKFLDDDFNNLFKSEVLIGTLSRVFAFLTILISCLGLFGLAAYTAERRTREIGIRKVMGASVSNLVGLLSKDFLKLVVISAVIAFPLGWLMMNKFLQDYAYRINIEWWVFAVAGALAIFIALFTVSFQAIKAAVANPVRSLRTE